ncbi:hypothetical protein [Fodinicola feengrottensis]|uniref:Uncharacterized protein n=1 Tax=Fodinicola feengrottensis TaxID=435914 RepID=A0ABN2J6U5_9ACTN|nr:hypothetical protein [Fodinicola feengrottensis]
MDSAFVRRTFVGCGSGQCGGLVGATDPIRDGYTLRADGDKGYVEIVARHPV